MPKKKPLQTIRKDDHWEMYVSESERNPNAPNTMRIPLTVAITYNKVYKEHIKRFILDIDLDTQGGVEIGKHNHSIGYHRTIIGGVVSSSFAITGLLLAFAGEKFGNLFSDTDEASKGMLIAGFVISALGTVISTICAIYITMSQDKDNRDKEHFQNLVQLNRRLPKIKDETDLKDKVIGMAIKLLKIKDEEIDPNNNLIPNAIPKMTYINYFASALDSKDDLNVYMTVENSLLQIAKSRFIKIKAHDGDERTKLLFALNQLMLIKFAERYYEANSSTFDRINVNVLQTINQSIKTIKNSSFILPTSTDKTEDTYYLFKIIVEILENHPRLLALTRFYDWLHDHCHILDEINFKYNKIAIINLCYKALMDETEYSNLLNNLNSMFDDINNNKQTNFVFYIKKINNINAPTITTVNSLISQIKNNAQINPKYSKLYENIIKSMVHILASDEAFNLIINPNSMPKYRP